MITACGMDPVSWYLCRTSFWEEHGGSGDLTEVQRLVAESALARGDRIQAAKLLGDWREAKHRPKPECRVSKYVPGAHFYVLDEKFDTEGEARAHGAMRGFSVIAGVHELRIDDLVRGRRGSPAP